MLEQLLQGALTTVGIAAAALAIGIAGGVCLGILNSRECRLPVLSPLIQGYVLVLRGTPLFVQVLIFYFALPEAFGIDLSPFAAGVAALGLNSTAYVSEIVRCGIDSIPEGQWQAADVLGYSRAQTVQSVILPQMVRNVLPALTNEMTSLIKETSILMAIGVTELTKVGRDIVTRQLDPLPVYLAVAGVYFVMTTAVSACAKYLEKRLKV
jgi:His/Glu/Gln/Arg/opine family amino acid ABC transporter permease subunit